MMPLIRVSQTAVEGSALVAARAVCGDERVASVLFEQDYDPEFVSRHTRQLASLMESYVEAQD